MPYIRESSVLDILPIGQIGPHLNSPGDLNYALTKVVIGYLEHHGLYYQSCNDVVGALDNAKHEFKRRIQDPYEDTKIKENGDVYPQALLQEASR